MRKQKNARGVITRNKFTQTIIEAPKKKNGKPNKRYPGHKTIVHSLTAKS